jgi:methylated-DNA-[protein]-cysteine S-methyltransferase
MSEIAFALFDTAIGRCAIVWNAYGIAGVGFPEGNEQATRTRLLRRHPAAREASAPHDVRGVMDDIVALLAGSPRDLGYARLDMTGLSDLQRRVYDVARKIPAGATLTYGEIAELLGDRLLARDVGEALGHNPFPIIVPREANSAGFPRPVAFAPSSGSWKSRARSPVVRRFSPICR